SDERDLVVFFWRDCEYVFVNETLVRQRACQRDLVAGKGQSGCRHLQEGMPHRCQQPLETDIADRGGLKQAEKQRVGRDCVEVATEQFVQRQKLRPCGGLTAERFRKL